MGVGVGVGVGVGLVVGVGVGVGVVNVAAVEKVLLSAVAFVAKAAYVPTTQIAEQTSNSNVKKYLYFFMFLPVVSQVVYGHVFQFAFLFLFSYSLIQIQ